MLSGQFPLNDITYQVIPWVSVLQVNKGVEATLVQLLETGLLHADPHPGNLLYTPSRQIG